MATRGTGNGLTSLFEHLGCDSTDSELQKSAYNDRYIVH